MFLPSVLCGDEIGGKLMSGATMERDKLRSDVIARNASIYIQKIYEIGDNYRQKWRTRLSNNTIVEFR